MLDRWQNSREVQVDHTAANRDDMSGLRTILMLDDAHKIQPVQLPRQASIPVLFEPLAQGFRERLLRCRQSFLANRANVAQSMSIGASSTRES